MKAAIYTRVSTNDQSPEMQISDLRQYCMQRSFDIYKEYSDQGISGTKDSRPALNELMDDAKKRRFNAVLCWRFDRFARSTKHFITALEEFRHLGIEFISYQENIDTFTFGKSDLYHRLGHRRTERNIIVERVKGGLRRAKEKGKILGRPKADLHIDNILKMRAQGLSFEKIGNKMGVCAATIYNATKKGKERG